jgi:CelD/BcsL family acetyltransferase involved in cellulose biosynthesis
MMPDSQVKVYKDLASAHGLRNQWDELNGLSEARSPFSSYEWLSCWYRAYCQASAIRIVAVYSNGQLRAVLPGFLKRKRIGPFIFNVFCYAGTGQTPLCGVIAASGDMEAAREALNTVGTVDKAIHLGILPDVETGSLTWKTLEENSFNCLHVLSEDKYKAPGFTMPKGWDDYLASKSKKFRKRLKESLNSSQKLGSIGFQIFQTGDRFEEGIERLKQLDAKSWQGRAGRGLFTKGGDDAFFNNLVSADSNYLRYLICFMRIGNEDAAFTTAVCSEREVFLLKTGYDKQFESCRPGVLVRAHICEILAGEGITNVDLGSDESEEKSRWQSHNRDYESFWLCNRSTFKGWLLLLGVRVYRTLRGRSL